MILGLITARKGSKGVANKNMRPLCSKPLIEYTMEAAQNASKLDRIFLSTNMDDAIETAASYDRIEVPFRRPERLCSDEAAMVDVLDHALQSFRNENGSFPSGIVLLQPTSPFRTSEEIDNAIATYRKEQATSLIAVAPPICHPSDCIYTKSSNSRFEWVFKQTETNRRQDYLQTHFITGSLYISHPSLVVDQHKIFDENASLFSVSPWNSIDIDNATDWDLAEALMERHRRVS